MPEELPNEDVIFEAVERFSRLHAEGHTPDLVEFVSEFPETTRQSIADQCRMIREMDSVFGRDLVRPGVEDGPSDARRLGDYEILEELGRGGMGVVYRAKQLSLGRIVALKVLAPSLSMSSRHVERFRREAEVASRLDDPGVVTVYDTGTHDGSVFIAMRYVEGETLAKKVARAREALGDASVEATTTGVELPSASSRHMHQQTSTTRAHAEIEPVLVLFERIAGSLHVAHEAGLIHRDIKPGNIIVDESGSPVLVDFGLARDEQDTSAVTLSGDLVGTPSYMSPEQVVGRIQLDRRTDIYSLGATLFECLTLRRPFEAPTRDGLYQQIVTGDPPSGRRLNPKISKDLDSVLKVSLEKARERRYQSALDFAEDLRRIRSREPILASPPSALIKFGRLVQRHPALFASIAFGLVSLAVGLVIALSLMQTAREANRRSSESLERFDALADVIRLREARESAASLYPAWPHRAKELGAWLDESGRPLVAKLAEHEARLKGLALAGVDSATEDFLRETLADFVVDLKKFAGPDGTVGDVESRLDWAKEVERLTLEEAKPRWEKARLAVARSSKYRGLTLTPQIGLVPLGADPKSGFEEFGHPRSGRVPERGEDGELRITDDVGLVFVLLPGGSFRCGAQSADEDGWNYDPESDHEEGPVHIVELAPFFISKYEMSIGQWAKLGGRKPNTVDRRRVHQTGPRHPVEGMNWIDATGLLHRFVLRLPTEAQWEYAARAGTDTPWWSGRRVRRLRAAANVMDQSFGRRFGVPAEVCGPFDDGHQMYGPIDIKRPNPFGLFNTIGNVAEWCRDVRTDYGPDAVLAPGDAERSGGARDLRVTRGGSYTQPPRMCRVSFRPWRNEKLGEGYIGIRPIRELDATGVSREK